MNCNRCDKDIEHSACVYRVHGLNGYYCHTCACALCRILGVSMDKVINIPYYTE